MPKHMHTHMRMHTPQVRKLLELLDEVDSQSEQGHAVHNLLVSLRSELAESGALGSRARGQAPGARSQVPGAIVPSPPLVSASACDVEAYDGFSEEASRLVFHYADHFTHLPERPLGRTFLPSGVRENEPKRLPIRYQAHIEPTSFGPYMTLMLTSPGPCVVILWQPL